MSVVITEEVFARLVGRYPDRDILLFQVAPEFLEGDPFWAQDGPWSAPVQYRIDRQDSGLVDLVIRRVTE